MLGLFSEPSRSVVLAGSGRGGTTWIGNIIAANPNMRIIFEPFDPRRVPAAKGLPLFAYAHPDREYSLLHNYVEKVLAGAVNNEWISRQGNRWWATRRLVKAIRANLMLGWMDRNFHPKIVFVTRHPCAVVLSRMKLKWDTHIDDMLSQPELVQDHLLPYMDVIERARTDLQKQTVMWCIENMIPLQQMYDYNWVVCTYEELYTRPEQQAERVLTTLDIRTTWLTRRAIHRTSVVTRPDSAIVTGKNPLREWQYSLSPDDIDEILSIAADFYITLYDADIMPHSKTQQRTRVPSTGQPAPSTV